MRRIVTTVISDLSGDPAETVKFSFGSAKYEVDLTSAERIEMMRALQPYIENGRRVGGPRPKKD